MGYDLGMLKVTVLGRPLGTVAMKAEPITQAPAALYAKVFCRSCGETTGGGWKTKCSPGERSVQQNQNWVFCVPSAAPSYQNGSWGPYSTCGFFRGTTLLDKLVTSRTVTSTDGDCVPARTATATVTTTNPVFAQVDVSALQQALSLKQRYTLRNYNLTPEEDALFGALHQSYSQYCVGMCPWTHKGPFRELEDGYIPFVRFDNQGREWGIFFSYHPLIKDPGTVVHYGAYGSRPPAPLGTREHNGDPNESGVTDQAGNILRFDRTSLLVVAPVNEYIIENLGAIPPVHESTWELVEDAWDALKSAICAIATSPAAQMVVSITSSIALSPGAAAVANGGVKAVAASCTSGGAPLPPITNSGAGTYPAGTITTFDEDNGVWRVGIPLAIIDPANPDVTHMEIATSAVDPTIAATAAASAPPVSASGAVMATKSASFGDAASTGLPSAGFVTAAMEKLEKAEFDKKTGTSSPIYTKWWFWTAIGAGVLALGGGAYWYMKKRKAKATGALKGHEKKPRFQFERLR